MDDSTPRERKAPGEHPAGVARRLWSHWPVLVMVGGPLLGAALGAAYGLAVYDDTVVVRTPRGIPYEIEPLLTRAQLAFSLAFLGLAAGAVASLVILGVVALVRRPMARG